MVRKQNAKKYTKRRPKNQPHLHFEDEKSKLLLYDCEKALRKAKRVGKIVHKQNATNANLTCTTSNEAAQVRKQPEEVNKCPSVPWKKKTFLGRLKL